MPAESRPDFDKALKKFYQDNNIQQIPRDLPILSKFCKEYNLDKNIFSPYQNLFVQHLLGPIIARLYIMKEYGLDPHKSWFVDIPYSTCIEARHHLRILGIPVSQMLPLFNDPLADYNTRQIDRVEFVLREICSRKITARLLVIDDGAYFCRTLRNLCRRDKHGNDEQLFHRLKNMDIRIVEQTTRGHRFITDNCLDLLEEFNIPVVSIARSRSKSILESPFIGAGVARAVINVLKEKYYNFEEMGSVLVMGFGYVGKHVTKELIRHGLREVHVWDKKNHTIQDEIIEAGAIPLKKIPETGTYQAVFGCTGHNSFKLKHLDLIDQDALLISGSSAAIEFNREKFINQAYKKSGDDFYIIEPEKTRLSGDGIQSAIHLQKGEKRFTFLNAGFPVNFNGRLENVPAEIIQITHTLMVAAAMDVVNRDPGFHELPDEYDDWIYSQGVDAINKYAES